MAALVLVLDRSAYYGYALNDSMMVESSTQEDAISTQIQSEIMMTDIEDETRARMLQNKKVCIAKKNMSDSNFCMKKCNPGNPSKKCKNKCKCGNPQTMYGMACTAKNFSNTSQTQFCGPNCNNWQFKKKKCANKCKCFFYKNSWSG